MDIIFLDANIFFAAVWSEKGASRMLFRLAEKKKLELISCEYAIEEAKRNIETKIGPQKLPAFFRFLSELTFLDRKSLHHSEFQFFRDVIPLKDMPILASAYRKKNALYALITLDRKDFFTKKIRALQLPFRIMLPGDYLKDFLEKNL